MCSVARAAVSVPVEIGEEDKKRQRYPHYEQLAPAGVVASQVHVEQHVTKARPELRLQKKNRKTETHFVVAVDNNNGVIVIHQ